MEPPKGKGDAHGGIPTFQQKPIAVGKLTTPLTNFNPTFVSTSGIPHIVDSVLEIYCTRDTQLRRLMPACLLKYVFTLCVFARLARLANKTGSSSIRDFDRLLAVTKHIRLPNMLARYVETIGLWTTPNGVTICPLTFETLANYLVAYHRVPAPHRLEIDDYYYSHRTVEDDVDEYLDNYYAHFAQQVGPRPPREQPRTVWQYREDFVRFYNSNTRVDRMGISFREVAHDELEGKEELLSCFSVVPGTEEFYSQAALQMSEGNALLGSCFRFRTSDPSTWIPARGNNAVSGTYFTAPVLVDPRTHICEVERQHVLRD
jgi:hypothetical protein